MTDCSMKKLFQRLAGRRYYRIFVLSGLLLAVRALYHLAFMAMFVHESVVLPGEVTDVRQKPFEDTISALVHGSGSCAGDVSYQPFVRFTLPSGIVINRLMTDAGNEDYTIGQSVEVITPALDPSGARINQWKYLWGTETLELGVGILLALAGFALRGTLFRRRKSSGKNNGQPEEAPQRGRKKSASGTRKSSSSRGKKKTAADSPAPKRRSRSKKAE